MGAAENLLFVLPPDCSKGNSHIVPRADDCIMLAGLLKAVKLCRPFDLFNIFAWRNAVIKPAVTYRFYCSVSDFSAPGVYIILRFGYCISQATKR